MVPPGHEQHGVRDDTAQEREGDALPGGPHPVQPEPPRRGDGLEQDERYQQRVRPDRGTGGEEQAEPGGDRGGLRPGRDDRRPTLGAGPLGVGDPAVAQGGGRTVPVVGGVRLGGGVLPGGVLRCRGLRVRLGRGVRLCGAPYRGAPWGAPGCDGAPGYCAPGPVESGGPYAAARPGVCAPVAGAAGRGRIEGWYWVSQVWPCQVCAAP
ncbi:hypothetical protein [Streptomyces sp. NRRL WC-3549]|uniref:hypothetical protein n=1 Tax=Streptomyces sp. NRRL WC-3549 TaxID=1463925 RepID=UPI003B6347E7